MEASTNTLKNRYFLNRLNPNTRRVFFSNFFQAVSGPIVSIFINAFIWRTTSSVLSVALYNAGDFLFLPLGFLINGFLLRKVPINTAYWIGACSRGLTIALVAFFGGGSMIRIFLLGCLWGFGNGFYWANRNYLELQETKDSERLYFYGLLSSTSTLCDVVIPFAAGWFIAFGRYSSWYTPIHAYWSLFVLAFVMMVGTAAVISRGHFETPQIQSLTKVRFRKFGKRRILSASKGFMDAFSFVPTLLILFFLGTEGVLGTVSAATSLFIGGLLYWYSRRGNRRNQKRKLILRSVVLAFSAALLAFLPSPANAVAYIAISAIPISLFHVISEPMLMFFTDEEMGNNTQFRYSFILDNELSLNIGRIIAMGILLLPFLFASQLAILTYGPFLVALAQLSILVFITSRSSGETFSL